MRLRKLKWKEIPINDYTEFRDEDDQPYTLYIKDGKYLVSGYKKRKTLDDIFDGYKGSCNCGETDTGEPVGKEKI